MAYVGVWNEAIEDPHLKPLGEFLAKQEKGWDKLTSESGKEVVRLVFKQTLCTHFLPRTQRLEEL